MRKIKRFLSALLCGAILITGTLAGVSVRTDAAASSYAVQLRAAGFPDSYISALSALHDLKYAIDNEVWQEWCEAVMACQTDRSLKSTLTPIVSKLSDMRVVNGELENLVFGPRKEFVTMAILVLINIPLVRFINTDWYHTLVDTIPGQMVIAVCIAAVFVSFAFVVKLTQPIEYRR